MESKITRRQVLVTTGTVALVGLAATEGAAGAAGTAGPAGATLAAAGAPAAGAEVANRVVAATAPAAVPSAVSAPASLVEKGPLRLLDGLLSGAELAIGQRELAPHRPGVLKLDLVWQWRQELQGRIAQGDELTAVTRWDKALLLKELARESRFAVRQERVAGSLFRTEVSSAVAT